MILQIFLEYKIMNYINEIFIFIYKSQFQINFLLIFLLFFHKNLYYYNKSIFIIINCKLKVSLLT
jgi:hypothetical protein